MMRVETQVIVCVSVSAIVGVKELSETLVYRYSEVQTALARMHGAYPDHVGALRARLQHFQRLGLVPSSPGRGKTITYTLYDVGRWAFALELIEFGIDPAKVAAIMSWLWLEVGRYVCDQHDGEYVFAAYPALLIGDVAEQEGVVVKNGGGGLVSLNIFDPKPTMIFDVADLPNFRPLRSIQVNLTQLRERLLKALAEGEL